MFCEWEPYEEGYKCKKCGFVSKVNFKKNCGITPPKLTKRIQNFTKASANHLMTGMKHCSDEQKKKRFEICKSNKCGLFLSKGEGGICSHDNCGCFIRSNGKFLDKLSWADSKCPEGFWGPETPEK